VASGLRSALRLSGKTLEECAAQVGVSSTQVDRWIAGQDKVTPEMQDRILTWLNRERAEIFSDVNPKDIDEGTLRWGTGLKKALASNAAGIDAPRLAQLVGQDATTVQAWVDCQRQVDQPMQFLIADKLGKSRDELFTVGREDLPSWAVGLRGALKKGTAGYGNAEALAKAIGSTRESVRRWMELKASVPLAVQAPIAQAMQLDTGQLFSLEPPLESDCRWACGLRECLRRRSMTAAQLAERIDTEPAWIRAWMEQEPCSGPAPPYCGQVPPQTQAALIEALDCTEAELFRRERASADFRWAIMPRFGDLIRAKGGAAELAERLDLDASRVERWLAGTEPVAPQTQLALLADLGLPVEEGAGLFTTRPPLVPGTAEAVWWAKGLREAVRVHPDYGNLGRLAAALQVPVHTLFDQVELLEPVPADLRDRIQRLLIPAGTAALGLFTTDKPNWSAFRWAPSLRAKLAALEQTAADLAAAVDTDSARVQDWMEMDQGDVPNLWAKGHVRKGQIAPGTCAAIVAALGNRFQESDLFASTRPTAGALWAIAPTFRMAVDATDGGLAGFARQIDTDPARVERWASQAEPVEAPMQDAILKVLGLGLGDRGQLFAAEPRTEDAVG
jgi:transcriptional regulator with XRE-family HTH domain